jgi:hypothetical protein
VGYIRDNNISFNEIYDELPFIFVDNYKDIFDEIKEFEKEYIYMLEHNLLTAAFTSACAVRAMPGNLGQIPSPFFRVPNISAHR